MESTTIVTTLKIEDSNSAKLDYPHTTVNTLLKDRIEGVSLKGRTYYYQIKGSVDDKVKIVLEQCPSISIKK